MLIRLRSKDGNFRVELLPTSDATELLTKILETAPDANPSTITISNRPRGNEIQLTSLKGRNMKGLGLNHGDLVFVQYQPISHSNGEVGTGPDDTVASATVEAQKRPWESVQEEAVDLHWRPRTGKIPRGRDPRFCKHGSNGMCDYCMPLEPYDAAYHQEHNIKYLSYHAYLRKITPKSTASATSALPPLTPLSYKVKVPCPSSGHPPWPAGICTACQPSAITLQSQPFRMVDHLEIASMDVIDRFLQAWRKTGLQRFGWLIGHYETYDKVPMGVKAIVEAIYEPPQQGEVDGLTLGWPWEEESRIRKLAASASVPLTVVGYVFTDLTPTTEDKTKNVYKRHPHSFYLSSLEAIFAAKLQKDNPIPSRSSPTGQFGSRLVTAVLTATEDGQVDVAAYQVSEQAVAMVEADMIEASVEPGIVRVKEDDRSIDSARYVPDVFFSYKNEYGLEVKKSAKPCFPVEYLMVNVTHGFPQNPAPLFRSTQFPIENRQGLEDQSLEIVLKRLTQLEPSSIEDSRNSNSGVAHKRRALAEWLSDWHLITFLETTHLISSDDLKTFIRVASSPDLLEEPSQLDSLLETASWQMLVSLAQESAPARPSTLAPTSSSSHMDEGIPQEVFDQIAAEEAARAPESPRGVTMCPHCTFENEQGVSDCIMCGLPI
ncbi:hypothetical protein AX15_005730 [Amanita polypyramis BW_CC]|nr:hypothetical protein AX15_005730 [Amanita polypyramis BW_CC]